MWSLSVSVTPCSLPSPTLAARMLTTSENSEAASSVTPGAKVVAVTCIMHPRHR
jgi:hypothetical protein